MSFNILVSLFSVLFLTTACAAPRNQPHQMYDAGEVQLWGSCLEKQADSLSAKPDQLSKLKALSCYASLSDKETDDKAALILTEKGRKLAAEIIHIDPENGIAHYLAAFLAGRNAQLKPLMGLDLVKVIEQEALRAATLSPKVDYGGADRILGTLYLKAPEPPISVGDLDKSLEHYAKAVQIAPDYAQNRLGLAAAYLEDDSKEKACVQYNKILELEPEKNILENKVFLKLRSLCSTGKSLRK